MSSGCNSSHRGPLITDAAVTRPGALSFRRPLEVRPERLARMSGTGIARSYAFLPPEQGLE